MKKYAIRSVKIALFLVFLIFVIWAITRGSSIKPTTQITITSHTIYLSGNNAIPDSVMIVTRYNGAIVYSDWFNSGDAEATADSGELVFTDQLQDIDGGGGDGVYLITARAYDLDSTLYTNFHYSYEVGIGSYVDTVKDDLITANKIEANAIGASEIATDAIGSVELASNCIGNVHLQASAIGASELATSAVQEISADVKTLWGDTLTLLIAFRDSVNNAIADANKANFHSSGDTAQRDGSVLVASDNIGINWGDISNKDTEIEFSQTTVAFVDYATLAASQAGAWAGSVLKKADTTGAANYFRTKTVEDKTEYSLTTAERGHIEDSVYAQRTDYKATGFATSADGDSVIQAIADANKPNFMADVDSILNAIADANKANFMADVDSILQAIADANKANFKATTIDSVRKVYLVDSLDQSITTGGAGVRSITFLILDASDSSALADVRIEAHTSGSYYADCHTSIAGLCVLSLDDATWTIHVNDPPNDFTSPFTFIVTADSTDTLFGTVFAGSDPPSADKCNLYTSVYDAGGDSVEGCILYVSIPRQYWPVTLDANTITPYAVSCTSDVHGDMDINIWESNELTAGDTTLTVKFDLFLVDPNGNEIAKAYDYEVPDAASHQIVW